MPTNAKDFEAMQTETADLREDPKMVAGQDALRGKFDEVRSKLQQRFGQLGLAMMDLPRYRDQPLSNLRQLRLEPMVRDRVIMASKRDEGIGGADTAAGFTIWASVSGEVDAKIRSQNATDVATEFEDQLCHGVTKYYGLFCVNVDCRRRYVYVASREVLK